MGVKRPWWQTIRKLLVAVGIIVVCALGIALIVGIIGGYLFKWNWTGLSRKTLWDWLQLLIIPAVLAVGGYIINLTISRSEQEATKQRAQSEREAAEKHSKTEREIAQDNQRETALHEYIDKMSELLLRENLRKSKEDTEVRTIARVHTLAVLPHLDSGRKRSLLQFLYESGLIEKDKSVIDLQGADLSGVNLLLAYLPKVSLRGANLQEAILTGTNLCEADLRRAYLSGAKLNIVNLRDADLRDAQLGPTNLFGANLSGATLNVADLFEVHYEPANLRGARLNGANLSNAQLAKVTLSDAIMSGVTMIGANLYGADLRSVLLNGADLTEADLGESVLSGASLTEEQLKTVKSLKGATMPDGSLHP